MNIYLMWGYGGDTSGKTNVNPSFRTWKMGDELK